MKRQLGVSLIEVLVAMLLGSVLGLGTAMIASKAMMANRDANIQSLATMDIRAWLQVEDGCPKTESYLLTGNVQLSRSCAKNTESYSVTAIKNAANVFSPVSGITVTHYSATVNGGDVLAGASIQVTP